MDSTSGMLYWPFTVPIFLYTSAACLWWWCDSCEDRRTKIKKRGHTEAF